MTPVEAEPVRLGVVGVGRMGRLYARIIVEQPGCALAAICGKSAGPVDALVKNYGIPGYPAGQVGRMLDEHPEVNAVIVATPEWDHLGPSLEVLRRGKSLLLEKPMATSLADARSLATAVRKSGATFMLCQVLRFDPRFAVLQEAVRAKTIGRIRRIQARRDASAEAYARVAGRCPLPYWLLPHDIDIALWVSDCAPTRVAAQGIIQADGSPAGLVVELELDQDVRVTLESCWLHAGLPGRPHLDQMTLIGEEGRIEICPDEQGVLIYSRGGGVAPDTVYCPEVQGTLAGAFPEMVRHFLWCVRSGGRPAVGAGEGLRTMAVAAAIEQSLKTGGPVVPEPVAASEGASCPS